MRDNFINFPFKKLKKYFIIITYSYYYQDNLDFHIN